MKRHESIVPISREHHTGLLCSWKINQGLQKQADPARMQRYVDYFMQQHLQPHFADEEKILFRTIKHPWCDRAIAEHAQLQQLASSIAENASTDMLAAFADLLQQHIRFEERELFPFLEKELSAEQLAEAGKQLLELHGEISIDDYADEFWID